MNWIARICCLGALLFLPACFVSQKAHITSGVYLADGMVLFCAKDEPDCEAGFVEGDGYILYSGDPEEEDLRLRFEVLTASPEAGTIYIGEVELREEGETAWTYILARAAQDYVADTPAFDIVMPSCNDAEAADPAFRRADAYSCEVADYPAFRAYLIRTYESQFAAPDFWRDRSPAPTP